ncbi:hypothetical protein P4E94_15680 [Pontiellaceae bacterium B12219]|nr:hypothetical protein [Pontiellaceae bacterium B12219]
MKYTVTLTSLLILLTSSAMAETKNKSESTTQVALPAAAQELLKISGLEHLSSEDQEKVILLLATAIEKTQQAQSKNSDLGERAIRYVESQGYTACYMKIITVDGDDWLVVVNGIMTYATKDLPFGLSKYSFREGYYFCMTRAFGGISMMIDNYGRTQSFTFADWEEL